MNGCYIFGVLNELLSILEATLLFSQDVLFPIVLLFANVLARFMPAKHVTAPCRYLSANNQRSYQAGVGIFYRIHVWKITPRNAIRVLWSRPRSMGDFPLIVVHLSRSNGIVDDISASCAILILRTFILFPENETILRKWAIWYYWSNQDIRTDALIARSTFSWRLYEL